MSVLVAQRAAGIGRRTKVEVVDPHVGGELEAAVGRQALVVSERLVDVGVVAGDRTVNKQASTHART